ncbi:MAG: glycosyltransferase [Chitinophagales bacterium]
MDSDSKLENFTKHKPLVSVLMAVYNGGDYLKLALESILNQTYSNLEILIRNDCSTDDTLKILKGYAEKDPRIKIFSNEENLGYLKTMNRLFKQVNGQFFTTQDADDISKPTRIEEQINLLTSDPEMAICGLNYTLIDSNGEKIESHKQIFTEPTEIKEVLKKDFALRCGKTMAKKEVLDQIGFYREFFLKLGYEDYDWLARASINFKIGYVPKELYLYRVHHSAVREWIKGQPTYGDDLIRFLLQQRIKYGTDGLDSDGTLKLEFDQYFKKFDEDYRSNPITHVMRYESKVALNKKQYLKSFTINFQAIKKAPFQFRNYKNLVYCTYIITRRILKV